MRKAMEESNPNGPHQDNSFQTMKSELANHKPLNNTETELLLKIIQRNARPKATKGQEKLSPAERISQSPVAVEARNILMMRYMKLVIKRTEKILSELEAKNQITIDLQKREDILLGAAFWGISKAALAYKIGSRASFFTYFQASLKRIILREYYDNHDKLIIESEHLRVSYYPKVMAFIDQFRKRFGHSPTINEIAEGTRMKLDTVKAVLREEELRLEMPINPGDGNELVLGDII